MLIFSFMPGLVLFLMIVWQPALGPCVFLGLNPLIVGIARGQVGSSMLRPNEVLLGCILAAAGIRTVLLMLSGAWRPTPFDRMDAVLLGLAGMSSMLPLTWRVLRGYELSQDDVLYAMVLIKYYALFRVFRCSITTPRQVAACVAVAMASAAVVAIIAMFQVTNLLGVPQFLWKYYDQPFEGHTTVLVERGTSTVSSAFGVADMMIMSLVLALALLDRASPARGLLLGACGIFLSGCVVAGEFSGYIGLAIAVAAFGVLSGSLHRLIPIGLGAAVLVAVPFWAVIERRLAGFENQSGVPHSWHGRWENLERFFFPDLLSGLNWLLGVRPAPRVLAPETWRSWVYIESGYVWLLWIGGIPFLLAFAWFAATALQALRNAASRHDAVGAVATSGFCYIVALLALMLVDPHLTVRGSADLFFPLLALAFVPSHAVGASVPAFAAKEPAWQET